MKLKKLFHKNTICLVFIVLLGSSLRLYGLNWDDSHHLHPDERFIVLTAMTIHWPKNVSE